MEIKYFDRYQNAERVEKVYGDRLVRWLYSSELGKQMAPLICSYPLSKLYGEWQNTYISHKKVVPFIKNFDIAIDEYLAEPGREQFSADHEEAYTSFNSFFIRRFKPGKRPFVADAQIMPAFCESRYFGYESVTEHQTVPVKGKFLAAETLLSRPEWIQTFACGPMLLARLCPVDYHRFHYPDDGKVLAHYRVPGMLHSVNPIALQQKGDIFITNERQVTILETENFGRLAYVEVGATCVGKIVQSSSLTDFKRGQEKGYFLFGGSTVIVYGEPGRWKPSQDILDHTERRMETYVHLGDKIAVATKA